MTTRQARRAQQMAAKKKVALSWDLQKPISHIVSDEDIHYTLCGMWANIPAREKEWSAEVAEETCDMCREIFETGKRPVRPKAAMASEAQAEKAPPEGKEHEPSTVEGQRTGHPQRIPLDHLLDSPWQSRRVARDQDQKELVASIRQVGLIEPPAVRPAPGLEDMYQLVFGHRRLEAFKTLAREDPTFQTMPVIIRQVSDEEMALIGLEENRRRKGITPLDEARAIAHALETTGLTQTSIGKKLGLAQPTIANMLRVLELPDEILEKVADGRINYSAARELLVFRGKDGHVHINDMLNAITAARYSYSKEVTVKNIQGGIRAVVLYNDGHPSRKNVKWRAMDEEAQRHTGWSNPRRVFPMESYLKAVPNGVHAFFGAGEWACDTDAWDRLQAEAREKAGAVVRRKAEADLKRRAKADQKAMDALPKEVRQPSQHKAAKREGALNTRGDVIDVSPFVHTYYGDEKYHEREPDGREFLVLSEDLLARLDDPGECQERCTWGFHYGFDPERPDRTVALCSNDRCRGKKLGAMTRALNSRGRQMKREEDRAIEATIDGCMDSWRLGQPEAIILLTALANSVQLGRGYNRRNGWAWLLERLGAEADPALGYVRAEAVLERLKQEPREVLGRLLLGLALEHFRDDRDDWTSFEQRALPWAILLQTGEFPHETQEVPELEEVPEGAP